MKESAQAALTLAKVFTSQTLEKTDIHIHVPAGATPKDGPSAGVAMFLSLVSLLSAKPVRSDVAMTGEISLRGLVLPIGGVKEKTLAALRAGIRTVMLPKRNEKDLKDVPAEARQKLEFVFLDRVEDADQDGDRRVAVRRAEGGVAVFLVPGHNGRRSSSLRTARLLESRRESTTAATSWIHSGVSSNVGSWGSLSPGRRGSMGLRAKF